MQITYCIVMKRNIGYVMLIVVSNLPEEGAHLARKFDPSRNVKIASALQVSIS